MTDDKGLKRRLKAILKMRVTTGITITDLERAASLANLQHIFTCNGHSNLPTGGLYDGVPPDRNVLDHITGRSQSDQQAILEDLVRGGMINKTSIQVATAT